MFFDFENCFLYNDDMEIDEKKLEKIFEKLLERERKEAKKFMEKIFAEQREFKKELARILGKTELKTYGNERKKSGKII